MCFVCRFVTISQNRHTIINGYQVLNLLLQFFIMNSAVGHICASSHFCMGWTATSGRGIEKALTHRQEGDGLD